MIKLYASIVVMQLDTFYCLPDSIKYFNVTG